jgi:anti-sigma factor RsiW
VKCSACRNLLGAYQDGTLSANAAAQLRAHLDGCVGCRAFAEEMMVVEHRLGKLTQLEPKPDFTQLVMAAIRTMPAPAPQPSRIVWLGVYDLLAWALLIALAATGVFRWTQIAAAAGLTFAKFVVAADGLYRVAEHFHITTLALAGSIFEVLVLLAILIAGRRYLARTQPASFGAQSI